jgi:hypothetical protein
MASGERTAKEAQRRTEGESGVGSTVRLFVELGSPVLDHRRERAVVLAAVRAAVCLPLIPKRAERTEQSLDLNLDQVKHCEPTHQKNELQCT